MRRNATLLVWPPVATSTPFFASIRTVRPSVVAVIPSTRPELGLSRTMPANLCFRRIFAPLARADFSSARTMPEPRLVGSAVMISLLIGHCTAGTLTRHRRRRTGSGRLIGELHAVGDQELERGGVLVGEGAHEISVAVAALAMVVAHPVVEHLVSRILNSELLLATVTPAEVHISAAHHAVSADVEVLFDHDDGGPMLERRDGAGQPGSPRADLTKSALMSHRWPPLWASTS